MLEHITARLGRLAGQIGDVARALAMVCGRSGADLDAILVAPLTWMIRRQHLGFAKDRCQAGQREAARCCRLDDQQGKLIMRVTVPCNGLLFAALVAAPLSVNALPALAQASPPPAANATASTPKQVALTQKTIDQLIVAQKAINDAQAKAPKDMDAKAIQHKVDGIAKRSGFATSQDYIDASYSVAWCSPAWTTQATT